MSGPNSANAPILNSLWVSGVIPFFVGLALIINGLFVSKDRSRLPNKENATERELCKIGDQFLRCSPPTPLEFDSPSFGVTEGTTKHLNTPGRNG